MSALVFLAGVFVGIAFGIPILAAAVVAAWDSLESMSVEEAAAWLDEQGHHGDAEWLRTYYTLDRRSAVGYDEETPALSQA